MTEVTGPPKAGQLLSIDDDWLNRGEPGSKHSHKAAMFKFCSLPEYISTEPFNVSVEIQRTCSGKIEAWFRNTVRRVSETQFSSKFDNIGKTLHEIQRWFRKYEIENVDSKSSPNFSKEQHKDSERTILFPNILKKLDSSIPKAVKLVKKTSKLNVRLKTPQTATNRKEYKLATNSKCNTQDKILSSPYRSADNSKRINYNNYWPLQSNELTLRKHYDVNKRSSTKESSKDVLINSESNRVKIKYSPPPGDSTKTIPTEEVEICDHHNSSVHSKCSSAKCVESTKVISAEVASNISANKAAKIGNSEVPNMFRGGLKLKERVVVGLSVAAVIFTLMLLVDIQMDLGISGTHLVPSHGKIKYAVKEDGPESTYNRFRNRLLQKTHSIDGTNLEKCSSFTDLGVKFNNKSTFVEYTCKIVSSAYKTLGFVTRNSNQCIDPNTLRLLTHL
ncbi:hypothetical protein JTB14_004566 [Gonioctena quinquepunctata]|nr:hypothetical protein JTB14_004566 [Gonioctena quinquepunctata]